jgi:hypothetical protein
MFESKKINQFAAPVSILVILGYFLYLMIPHLNNNLWNDEIYTLEKFTLVHLKTTLTDYHVPNNHVFYNLCNHFYLKIVGISTLRQAFEKPWILRLPLLFLSLATLLLLYKTGKLAGGKASGIVAVTLLAISAPFQNFCLQVRGYSFSMFFDLLLVYASLKFASKPQKKGWLTVLAITAVLTLYTIPSNFYCVIGLMAFWGICLLYTSIRRSEINWLCLQPIFALIAGIALALLCYSPMLSHVFSNDYVRSARSAFSHESIEDMHKYFNEITSGKILLHLLFYISAIFFSFFFLLRRSGIAGKAAQLILLQFITPFVMVILRGENPPDRVFAYLLSFLALLVAAVVVGVFDALFSKPLKYAATALLLMYLFAVSQHQIANNLQHARWDTEHEKRQQNLLYDYYIENYHPLAIAQYLAGPERDKQIPVILKSSEPHDMPEYLAAFNIPYHSPDSTDYYLQSAHKLYLITIMPHEMDSTFKAQHHCAVAEVLPPAYHHLLQLTSE